MTHEVRHLPARDARGALDHDDAAVRGRDQLRERDPGPQAERTNRRRRDALRLDDLNGDQLEESERIAAQTVRALGLQTGIAFPQLIAAPDGRVIVVECAARIPGGQMADLVRHAVGVDLVDVQIRMAARRRAARRTRVAALQAAARDSLPHRRARAAADREGEARRPARPRAGHAGCRTGETYLAVGETIRPVRLDGDRRGYVIAVADTNLEVLELAEAAAR